MRTISFEVTGQHIECTEAISDLVRESMCRQSFPCQQNGMD